MSQQQFHFRDTASDRIDHTKLARQTDPETSHQAADRQIKSGCVASNKKRLLDAVCEQPGLTSAEYAQMTQIDRHEAARRLSDLRHEKRVEQLPARVCTVRKTKALTWGLRWPQP